MLVLEPARGEYILRRENIIALGNSGTGKTRVALALVLSTCQKGFTVAFTAAAALVNQLMEARDEKRLLKLQRDLAAVKLLIVDELGMCCFHPRAPNCCSRPSRSAMSVDRRSPHRTCRSRTGRRSWDPSGSPAR